MQQPTQQILIQRSQPVNQIQTVQTAQQQTVQQPAQQPTQQPAQQPQAQQQTGTQQIVVNSNLAQMLTQGKVQMANVNGQQVLIKPIGNNQWHIVAHFKNQPDGTLQIVPTNNQSSENQSQQPLQVVPQVPQQQQTVTKPGKAQQQNQLRFSFRTELSCN